MPEGFFLSCYKLYVVWYDIQMPFDDIVIVPVQRGPSVGRADHAHVLHLGHGAAGVHHARAPAALPLGRRAEPRLLPRPRPHPLLRQPASL